MFLEKVSFGAIDVDREIVSLLFTHICDRIIFKTYCNERWVCSAFGKEGDVQGNKFMIHYIRRKAIGYHSTYRFEPPHVLLLIPCTIRY